MSIEEWVEDHLAGGRSLRSTQHGVLTVFDRDSGDSRYDRHAALYDRLVGNRVYNRLVWGAWPAAYTAFAEKAAGDGSGPLLDVGCGSAVFTGGVYRECRRPLVLVDRSAGMLARARHRVNAGTPPAVFLQADLFDLPFDPPSFPTVTSYGVVHLFDDAATVLRALRDQVADGGTLYASSLVAETRTGSRWLAMMHRSGEIAAPRTAAQLADVARAALGDGVEIHTTGCMAFLTARL